MPNFKVILESLAPSFTVGAFTAAPQEMMEWAENQTRFPQRNVAALPFHRQLEHRAVDLVLGHMTSDAVGKSPTRSVIHDANGKPQFTNDPHLFLSIAHHSHGQHCWAAVALSEAPVGCDIESLRPQLQKVSERFLSPEERLSAGENTDGLCAIWCVKESMFKAFGPSLNFREDLHVTWIGDSAAIDRGIDGLIRDVKGLYRAWRIEETDEKNTLMQFWAVCGPVALT